MTALLGKATPPDDCDECVRQDGLCRRHEKSILPQLAQPGWVRLIVSNYGAPTPPSPEAQKIMSRRERRRARRMREIELAVIRLAAQ